MSIFMETMTKAISDYRLLLRRHLSQVDRMVKLQKLGLRDSELYENELVMYNLGLAIINDVEENMVNSTSGYYSYSGLQQFADYLKEYLNQYTVEGNNVVHAAQKASKAMLSSIQLLGLTREKLDESILKQLFDFNKTIVSFGSTQQCEMQLQLLTKQQQKNPGFYTRVIAQLESLIACQRSEAA